MAFLFKIKIKGITSPPVWRSVIVPEQFTFYQFHEVIQAAFGWWDSHLFQFSEQGFDSLISIGIPDPDFDEFETKDAKKIKINKIFKVKGQKYTYVYDYGDYWEHTIVLESIIDAKVKEANCLDGKGKCPPEDCGGVHGFKELKRILLDPKDPEYESMREWLGLAEGDVWDPKAFDFAEARKLVNAV